jgi:hypothetical protein
MARSWNLSTILEFKKDAAVLDRIAVKTGGLKLRTRSFTRPSVEAGSIIEYRWWETRYAEYIRLYFQTEIPIWEVRYQSSLAPTCGSSSAHFSSK